MIGFRPGMSQFLSLILGVSLAALGVVLLMEFALHLPPCILCLAQRIPFVLAIIFSGFALARMRWRPAALWILAGLFLINLFIATFQVGEEQRWWGVNAAGNSEVCTAPNAATQSVEDLYASMSGRPMGDCAHPEFSWHGLTFAAMNAILCFVLTIIAAYGAARGNPDD